jgi:hypothetical protein
MTGSSALAAVPLPIRLDRERDGAGSGQYLSGALLVLPTHGLHSIKIFTSKLME